MNSIYNESFMGVSSLYNHYNIQFDKNFITYNLAQSIIKYAKILVGNIYISVDVG